MRRAQTWAAVTMSLGLVRRPKHQRAVEIEDEQLAEVVRMRQVPRIQRRQREIGRRWLTRWRRGFQVGRRLRSLGGGWLAASAIRNAVLSVRRRRAK